MQSKELQVARDAEIASIEETLWMVIAHCRQGITGSRSHIEGKFKLQINVGVRKSHQVLLQLILCLVLMLPKLWQLDRLQPK